MKRSHSSAQGKPLLHLQNVSVIPERERRPTEVGTGLSVVYNIRVRERFDDGYVWGTLKNTDYLLSIPPTLTRAMGMWSTHFQDGIDNKLIYNAAMRSIMVLILVSGQHLSGRVPINLHSPGVFISPDFLRSQDEIYSRVWISEMGRHSLVCVLRSHGHSMCRQKHQAFI